MVEHLLQALKRSVLGRYWLNNRITTIRYGIAKGFKRRGGRGVMGIFLDRQTQEDRFLQLLPMEGKTIYDIGANFGAFSLFFASKVGPKGQVIIFDPIPENCQAIEANLLLNNLREGVTIFCKGVGSKYAKLLLTYLPGNTSTASFEKGCSQALREYGNTACIESELVPLDDFIRASKLRVPDFVKIDVEGYEFDVLKGMEDLLTLAKPQLFIELHGKGLEGKQRIAEQVIRLLFDKNYCIYHVESGKQVLSSCDVTKGHLYCSMAPVPY